MKSPLGLERRLLQTALVFGSGGAIICILLLRPLMIPFFSVNSCGMKTLTGLPCPLCGCTRSLLALLHGQLSLSFYFNPLALPLTIAGIFVAAWLLSEALIGRELWDRKILTALLRKGLPIFVPLLLVWWIFHIVDALRTPKPELMNPNHPVAAAISRWIRPDQMNEFPTAIPQSEPHSAQHP